jgi:pimeloyl-ACP methyl ester carboxylesterase
MAKLLFALALCGVALAGCGGGGNDDRAARTQAKAPALTGAGITGSGRLVDIGDGRTLYLECIGSGSPTIVLEAGFGSPSKAWVDVQETLGRITRTCSYDRAGLGSSLAIPGVHDANDEIHDLERLLAAARIERPYVLVGHSYGGLLARLFARAHPDDTAGVVLVDSMGRNQTRRAMRVWPKSVAPGVRRDFAEPVIDGVDLRAGERAAAEIDSLPDVPLAVVTAGRHGVGLENLPRSLRTRLDRQWTTMQDELAALSPDHLHVVALRSDHFVQRLDGQPGVVIRAVRAVVRAARADEPLPRCTDVFHGAGVRCRG